MAEDFKRLTDEEVKNFLEEIRKRASYLRASEVNEDGEMYDLLCPKCGCDKIVAESPDLGVPAKCYECGHEFIITQNCFKLSQDGFGETDWGFPVGGEEW